MLALCPITQIHSRLSPVFGLFQLWLKTETAINIYIQAVTDAYVFTSEEHVVILFTILRNCQTFPIDCTMTHLHQQCVQFQLLCGLNWAGLISLHSVLILIQPWWNIRNWGEAHIGLLQWLRAFVVLKGTQVQVLAPSSDSQLSCLPSWGIQHPPLTSVDSKHLCGTHASMWQDAHTHKGIFCKIWKRAREMAQWAKVPVPRLTTGVWSQESTW